MLRKERVNELQEKLKMMSAKKNVLEGEKVKKSLMEQLDKLDKESKMWLINELMENARRRKGRNCR